MGKLLNPWHLEHKKWMLYEKESFVHMKYEQ